MDGPYLRQELSYDLEKYRMPIKMKKMIQKFRDEIAIPMLEEEEYAAMCNN